MAVSRFRTIAVRANTSAQTSLPQITGVQVKKMSAKRDETPIIPLKEAKRFVKDCLEVVGTPEKYAEAQADLLIAADYRGHFSHGMNRLDMYINEISCKTCDAKAVPKILKETPATAWVSGENGLGAVVGTFCMDLAIKKAKAVGIGWVSAKESNHYGIAGFYAMQAVQEGLLGMSFTNSSPFMCPTRAKKAALGTNPLALAAPSKTKGDSFVLDMATTTVAVGKIEIQKRRQSPIPEGWALDSTGQMTTDPTVAYDARRLMPLGGSELGSGYKGFGLGMLVEIFCGILSGANYGPKIREWGSSGSAADLGQCFVAIDPKCFAPGFDDRMGDLMDTIRCFDPVDPSKPVLIPGDPERNHMKLVDAAGGLRYLKNQMDACNELAKKLSVKPLNS